MEGHIRVLKAGVGMREIVPDAISMKHLYGEDMSVALFHIVAKAGQPVPIASHSHGEEMLYVLKGGLTLNGQDLEAGDIAVIPAGLEHGGDTAEVRPGELLLLSVITPSQDYGPDGDGERR